MESNIKKILAQAFLNHGCLALDKAKQTLTKICNQYKSADLDLMYLIEEINENLTEFGHMFKIIPHPLMDQEFLVFSLTSETEVSKLCPNYAEEDRLYFSKLIDALVEEEDYGIPSLDVYKFGNSVHCKGKPLSKSLMNQLIQIWIQQGYFLEKDNKLYIGVRLLSEFESFLKLHYTAFIKECPLCLKIVLWDTKCNNCMGKMHRQCIRKFLARSSVCPICKNIWNTDLNL